jgi:hypothetical protein
MNRVLFLVARPPATTRATAALGIAPAGPKSTGTPPGSGTRAG